MLRLLTLICSLHFCVVYGDNCGRENVSGAVGGDVILRVHRTGITFISWVLLPEGGVIVTTEPGITIDDRKVRTQYRGRVRSEDDGSLHIYDLSLTDQRLYAADIQSEGREICVQFYLTVYERLSPGDLKISPSITSNGTCSLGLLCTVDKPDVTITWSNEHSGDINVTGGVLYVPPSEVNFTYICTAQNPVSNVSETVIPGEYCTTGEPDTGPRTSNGRYYLALLAILPVACLIIIFYKVRNGRSPNNELLTTYDQVRDPQIQAGNVYQQSQEETRECTTLYSEIQLVKKTNSEKKLAGKEANATRTVETEYSTVQLPKGSQANGTNAQPPGSMLYNNVTNVKA